MIHRLKQQSDTTKRRIAFGVSGLVSALVFVGWLASFGAPDTSERVVRNREASPLRLLVQGVQSTIKESASEFTPTNPPRIVDLRAGSENPVTRQSASIFSAFTSIPDNPSLLSEENASRVPSEEGVSEGVGEPPQETGVIPQNPPPPPPSQPPEPVSQPSRPVEPAPKKELVIIIPSRN
jgi:hypothetical protein